MQESIGTIEAAAASASMKGGMMRGDRRRQDTAVNGPRTASARDAEAEALLASLVREMATGEEPALERLFELTVDRVHAFALRIVQNVADADEVVADTYAQAWSGAGKFSSDRAAVMSWLLMMCRSRAIDLIRRRRTDHERFDPDTSMLAAPLDESIGDRDRLLRVIDQLAPRQQAVIVLAYFRGLTHAEIAERLAIPIGSVKTHMFRGIQQLRELLA